MSRVVVLACWTGYAVWLAAAWALLSKAAAIADRFVSERRRWRNARRFCTWRPPPRPQDPGSDVTRVLPAIQRPKGPVKR